MSENLKENSVISNVSKKDEDIVMNTSYNGISINPFKDIEFAEITNKEIIEADFMKVIEDVPAYKHEQGDAGYDLYASEDTWIFPFRAKKVPLNLRCSLPNGKFGIVTSRSGESLKGNFVVPGIIDCNYTGVISAIMTRIGLFPRKIKKGTRIAQMIIIDYHDVDFKKVNTLEKTSRGDNGFGSSGNK